MRNGIERGESILRTAQNAAVFNPVVLQMIAVGEETGSIDELMQEVAEMYEREVDYEIQDARRTHRTIDHHRHGRHRPGAGARRVPADVDLARVAIK